MDKTTTMKIIDEQSKIKYIHMYIQEYVSVCVCAVAQLCVD